MKIFFFDIDGTLAIKKHIPQNNKKMLQEMHKNALKLGKPNSSDLIYKSIKELVGNEDGKSN